MNLRRALFFALGADLSRRPGGHALAGIGGPAQSDQGELPAQRIAGAVVDVPVHPELRRRDHGTVPEVDGVHDAVLSALRTGCLIVTSFQRSLTIFISV